MHQLAETFRRFAVAHQRGAPLYSKIADRVADEATVLDLMSAAPVMQRIPVLLFACAHHLLLSNPTGELAAHYPNISTRQADGDAGDLFVQFVLEHRDEMSALLATRSTQTNEIRRSNWFLFPFAMLERELGPLAHIDVGTSAGLNLLFPKLAFDIHPSGRIGDTSALTIQCDVRGQPPLTDHVPIVNWSVGIDAQPIDVHDEVAVRWLQACVWPDQVDRFTRLHRAIDLARQSNLRIDTGDAVENIVRLVAEASAYGHPTVTTSWVMNYLSPAQRNSFVNELVRIGTTTDVSWVIAESPLETPELPVSSSEGEDITVISLVTWRNGQQVTTRLARTHPHGNWIHWEL